MFSMSMWTCDCISFHTCCSDLRDLAGSIIEVFGSWQQPTVHAKVQQRQQCNARMYNIIRNTRPRLLFPFRAGQHRLSVVGLQCSDMIRRAMCRSANKHLCATAPAPGHADDKLKWTQHMCNAQAIFAQLVLFRHYRCLASITWTVQEKLCMQVLHTQAQNTIRNNCTAANQNKYNKFTHAKSMSHYVCAHIQAANHHACDTLSTCSCHQIEPCLLVLETCQLLSVP